MSSIHYKFRATLEYQTLQFDGLHIRGEDLVREICTKENINIELFNLLLQNAHTKKTYTDEELIPRNSSIIVQRVPRTEVKVQKVQSGVNSGMINQDSSSISADGGSHIPSADFENMDEAERLSHVKEVSTRAYDPSNFRKKTAGIMSGPPPPTYTCNRCYQPGHWYKNCPMLNTKKTTGIPSQELMQTTADDPLAMLHPSGKYVVPIMHWKARQNQLRKMEDGSSSPAQDRRVPAELECPICHNLIKEAVVTSCCGNSYCADCIGHFIVDSEAKKCPGSDCTNDQLKVTVDSLIPNKRLREAAEAWLNQKMASTAPPAPEGQAADPIRIRIGLQPKPMSSTQSLGVLSPGSVLTSDQTVVESAPGVTIPPVSVESIPIPVPAPVPEPTTSASVPQVPAAVIQPTPTTSQTINIPLDTSLPPPMIRQPAITAEPLVPGIPTISTYLQPPPGIPGISMVMQQQQQPQQMMSGYMLSGSSMGVYASGSAGFQTAPSAPTSSRNYDDWDTFLKNKSGRDERRMADVRRDTRRRSPHGRDRDREKERERERDRRRTRETRPRRKRTTSTTTESSDSSSSTSSDDERRRRKKEKTREELRKTRSAEKDRLKRDSERDRRERDRERERERSRRDRVQERESKSSRAKSMKVRVSRHETKEREGESRRRRKEVRREETEEDGVEKDMKEPKEEDDEAAIDGALAEYEKLRESTSEMNMDDNAPKDEDEESGRDSDHGKGGDEEDDEDTAQDEHVESGTEGCEGEGTRSERDASEPVQEVENVLTTETSEAEVTERAEGTATSANDATAPATEESDMTADEKDAERAANEKESQPSTANTDDDDGKKDKKREKKHKKHKKKDKKHRKRAEDDDDDSSDKKKKKHKKHKKEKKSKKTKKENDDDEEERDDDRDRKKHRKKDRKRDRETEDSDSDAPRSKNRRRSEDVLPPARPSRSRVEDSVREKDKHREERESEKKKDHDDQKKKKDVEHKKESTTTTDKFDKKDDLMSVSSTRKPISFVVTTPALKNSSSPSLLKTSPILKKTDTEPKKDEKRSSRDKRDSERAVEKSSDVRPKKSLSERLERRKREETDVESGEKSTGGDDSKSRRSRNAQMLRQVQKTLDANSK